MIVNGVFFENETLSPLKLFTLSNELATGSSHKQLHVHCTTAYSIYTASFHAAAFFVHFHSSLRHFSRFSATISSTDLSFGYPVIANLQCHNLITSEDETEGGGTYHGSA